MIDDHEPGRMGRRIPGVTSLAVAMAMGIALAWQAPGPIGRTPWPWLMLTAGTLVILAAKMSGWWGI